MKLLRKQAVQLGGAGGFACQSERSSDTLPEAGRRNRDETNQPTEASERQCVRQEIVAQRTAGTRLGTGQASPCTSYLRAGPIGGRAKTARPDGPDWLATRASWMPPMPLQRTAGQPSRFIAAACRRRAAFPDPQFWLPEIPVARTSQSPAPFGNNGPRRQVGRSPRRLVPACR